MRLGIIDYQFPRGGVERFIEGVLNNLPEQEVAITVFSTGYAFEGYKSLAQRLNRPITLTERAPLIHRMAAQIGSRTEFSWVQNFEVSPDHWDGIDIAWFPAVQRHVIRRDCLARTVATFHDAIPVEFGDYMADRRDPVGRTGQLYLMALDDYMTRRLMGSLAKVVVDAARTRDYLTATYGPLLRQPDIVYPSTKHVLDIVPAPIERLDLPERYVMFPANISPHKNHECLLIALAKVKAEAPEHFLPLVLSGSATLGIGLGGDYRADRLQSLVARLGLEIGRDLHLLGTVSDGHYRAVLGRASGLVFPSLAEGYGFPPIEAAMLGVPVACSDIEVVRETLDRLDIPSLWFDARSIDDTARALADLGRDQVVLAKRAQEAAERLHDASWNEVGRRYREILRQQAEFAAFREKYGG
jgi:glycosyltransferase involved in cell wall biosynthesis